MARRYTKSPLVIPPVALAPQGDPVDLEGYGKVVIGPAPGDLATFTPVESRAYHFILDYTRHRLSNDSMEAKRFSGGFIYDGSTVEVEYDTVYENETSGYASDNVGDPAIVGTTGPELVTLELTGTLKNSDIVIFWQWRIRGAVDPSAAPTL